VHRFRQNLAGEKNEISSLELLAEVGAAAGELLRATEIVDRGSVGILSERRRCAEQRDERNREALESSVHHLLRRNRKVYHHWEKRGECSAK